MGAGDGQDLRSTQGLRGDQAPDRRRLPSYAAGAVEVPFVAAGLVEDFHRDTWWEVHSHPTHELLTNRRGASTAVVGSRVWTITPATALWVPAGVPHSGMAPAGTSQHAVQFSVRQAPALAAEPVAVVVTPLLRLLLDRLEDPLLTAESRSRTETMIVDVLVPADHELVFQVPSDPLLQPIADAMYLDPADQTTLTGWARQLGASARTLTRRFREETGMGFRGWVTAVRVHRAIGMLSQGEPISEVAMQVGYGSASALTTAMQRVTGMTPGRFRP